MTKKLTIFLVVFMAVLMNATAQNEFQPLPELTSPKNVKVVDVGLFTQYVGKYVETDSLTGRQDTLYQVIPEIVWRSEGDDIREESMAPRRISSKEMKGTLNDFFTNVKFYVFVFQYESIDSEGKPVTLSGIAACPHTKESDEVKNVLIGTHITITADRERPSNQTDQLSASSDWGPLFAMSAGKPTSYGAALTAVRVLVGVVSLGLGEVAWATTDLVRKFKYEDCRHNLVVMPDYEGYGTTKNRAHPYLYQELTARQVADAAQAAMYAYQNDAGLKNISLKFRNDWKTVICGYSQGGSVAMATQRFMEQNHIDDKFHLVGSICGDGPYDPMATLMYYMKRDKENHKMPMAEVLPLIVKGMLDTNPYMLTHSAGDYFVGKFLDTGIMDWLTSKEMTTGDIEKGFKKCYEEGKYGREEYYRDIFNEKGRARLRDIMKPDCYKYFEDLYNQYKDTYNTAAGIPLPTKRGVMEDLHLALASNDVTDGWKPRHTILLFHSNVDNVVPYANAQRAVAKLGKWAVLHTADLEHDHGDSGVDFFAGDGKESVIGNDNLRITLAIKKLIDLPYSGQKEGAVTEW